MRTLYFGALERRLQLERLRTASLAYRLVNISVSDFTVTVNHSKSFSRSFLVDLSSSPYSDSGRTIMILPFVKLCLFLLESSSSYEGSHDSMFIT